MKNLKTYKQWEAVRLKGILTDYKFVYDHKSDEGRMFLTYGDKGTARLDVRALGKPVDGKFYDFMFAWPQDIELNQMFDFHFAANEIIRIFNKNKRNYKMTFEKVERHTLSSGRLSLKPWIEVKVFPAISLHEMEEIFGLSKLKDNEVAPKNIYDPVYRKLL